MGCPTRATPTPVLVQFLDYRVLARQAILQSLQASPQPPRRIPSTDPVEVPLGLRCLSCEPVYGCFTATSTPGLGPRPSSDAKGNPKDVIESAVGFPLKTRNTKATWRVSSGGFRGCFSATATNGYFNETRTASSPHLNNPSSNSNPRTPSTSYYHNLSNCM